MRSRVLELGNPIGAYHVRPLSDEPLVSTAARYWRFSVDFGRSRALLCMAEHDELPNDLVVTVSTDLRRLPLVWRWPGDWHFSRVLQTLLRESGGQDLADKA